MLALLALIVVCLTTELNSFPFSPTTSQKSNLLAKKKKTSAGEEAQSSSPRRVSNQINIPVRQQIAWAKALKRFQSQSKYSYTFIIAFMKIFLANRL